MVLRFCVSLLVYDKILKKCTFHFENWYISFCGLYLLENFGNQDGHIERSNEKIKKLIVKIDTFGIDTKKATEKYKKSIDIPLRNLVISMNRKDQEPRGEYPDFEKMKIVNEENTKILDSLLKINKYPHQRIVGKDDKNGENSDIGGIMIHTSQEYKENF